jgi:mxaA protein
MKTLTSKLLIIFTLLFQCAFAFADNNSFAILNLKNPQISSGIQIGDVLKRSVTFETKVSQKTLIKALPAKGTRNDEVELVASNLLLLKEGSKNQYRLELAYQVFTNVIKPKVMALPAETVKISSTEQIILPAWHFWFSPLVETDINNAKANVQPQLNSPTIDINQYEIGIRVFAGMMIFSIIGLIYLNANSQWLPFCKGHFAISHKQIKYLSRRKESDRNAIKLALFNLHTAFNKTYGSNLFAKDINDFVSQHPKFNSLRNQIEEFFSLSNLMLFSSHPQNNREFFLKLISISKNLRNCERGV